ncbi:transcriptional repressor [uncultured Pseudosulfitobacter sp.]|jgi:Fur family zinc uptake transcriptional regulator|uniref:transcriptional repressor n=1 Tax=uncultured Pseudosulfitobacter sp. TaxID=2854214 RepID=UPI0030D81723|tara:strand:+ start:14321 stop:14800 length:480 start_codon:yes stop_codon:yes gene_type:complete
MPAIGFHRHDHAACIDTSIAAAERHCATHKLKLTPVRRRALEILLREHRALGAYDLLAHLSEDGLGSQPPVAYRALDFLTSAGFAHKIERLNAYIACAHLGSDHAPAFLICRSCKSVAEAETEMARGRLGDAARDTGFKIERTVIEAEGLCPDCQDAAA